MTFISRMSLPTCSKAALMLLACFVSVPASAQTNAPANQPRPVLPDGFSVTPPLPVPRALGPETGGSGGEAAPDGESERRAVPHGGCRYQDQKLELLV